LFITWCCTSKQETCVVSCFYPLVSSVTITSIVPCPIYVQVACISVFICPVPFHNGICVQKTGQNFDHYFKALYVHRHIAEKVTRKLHFLRKRTVWEIYCSKQLWKVISISANQDVCLRFFLLTYRWKFALWEIFQADSKKANIIVSFSSRPLFPRSKIRGIHCIGCWVGSRAGLDA
jgi:hypothetical protein